MRTRRLLIATLLILAACAAPPSPTATPLPTPTLASTPAPTPALSEAEGPIPTPTLTPSPTPTPAPSETEEPTPVPSPTPPISPLRLPVSETSLDALTADPPPRPFDYTVVNPTPPRRVPNALRTFWVISGTTGERREVAARLRVQTEHAALWVEEGMWHDVRQLAAAADSFEAQVYPTTRAAFGSEWTPGVDNDPHVHILHVGTLGESVLGYTSAADEFPRAVYPYSNEAELIVVNVAAVEIGSPAYYALLARQFQRLIQWYNDRNEERWVKEGLAELAVQLNGLDPGGARQAYLEAPDTSLTAWADETSAVHRGAAYLLAAYFHERFGDAGTQALTAQPPNGAAGFDAVLAGLDGGLAFEDLFAGWLAANTLDGETDDPFYGYATLDLERPALAADYADYPVTLDGSVQQFGADYIRLSGESDLHVRFTGATATPLLPLLPHSGQHVWWSNRADESLTTLTRAFDFSGVPSATLTYWAWYDLEAGYDYVAVQASSDLPAQAGGGTTWQTLITPSGTGDNPRGNNPGWGYTGQSGDPPGWIQETVDLSSYAGGQVLLRFAYLTDEATTGLGFALDDVAIPEIGYADDVESETGGWEAAGFVRSDTLVPQHYLALLIGLGDGGVTVERLPVDEDQAAEWTVPLASQGWREAVLVLSGLAPLTTQPALYQLTIE